MQQLELVCPSRRQFALLLVDDSVVEGLDRQLQQPLVIGSVDLFWMICPTASHCLNGVGRGLDVSLA